jgi:hypothetical protein
MLRLRRISVVLVVALASFGIGGSTPAGALTLPPGNGEIACDVAGSVKIVRSVLRPDVARLRIAGRVSNCTYNGTPIPFAGGVSRTVAVSDPATICAVLTNGGTLARSVTRVVAFGSVVGSVSLWVTVSPAVPSGSGSAIDIDGTATVNGITIEVHASVQTDRPVTDLCNGTATYVLYTGGVTASWTRA